MPIYRDDRDRQIFLALLETACERHLVDCHAYCLMSNHYHAVITTREPNLSHAIQQLNADYAQCWNRRHARAGHVFQGRFGAQIVQDDLYLLMAARYVVLNPVRAGMVASPQEWAWSSYRATAGLQPIPPYLQPAAIWRCLGGGDTETTRQKYCEYVAMHEPSPLPRDPVIGGPDFVKEFESRRAEASREVPRRERHSRAPLENIFASAFTPTQRAERAVIARAEGYSLREISRFLGLHYSTVSKMVARGGGVRS